MPLKVPSAAAQQALIEYTSELLAKHRDNHELREKMAVIDRAYARYTELATEYQNGEGVDELVIQQELRDELGELRDSFIHVEIPLLVSQVDTFVAYATEIYLSGYPIFGIVTDPVNKKTGQYVEAMLDKHSRIGRYRRELQLFFRDCAKYNYAPVLVEWDTIQHFQRTSQEDVTLNDKPSISDVTLGYNKLKRLDPYNTFVDNSVLPGDASRMGDYQGYVELMTMQQLRRELKKLDKAGRGEVLNTNVALKSTHPSDKAYTVAPKVSKYTNPPREFDWDTYLSSVRSEKNDAPYGSKFEVSRFFIRAEPTDFKLKDDKGENVYKVVVVNQQHVVYIERVYMPFGYLPILMGQPHEDGLGLQTQSVAEAALPMQKAASGLVNMRFHAARRSIVDRALYDENMIEDDDVNNPSASAKIPVKTNALTNSDISKAYYSIPYRDTASNAMLNDALVVSDWTSDLNGLNRAAQGRFTKGNRTQGEFQDIMSAGEQRQRLPILVLEDQVFMPLKQTMLLNTMRYASGEVVQAQDTGEALEADVNELTNIVLDFKVADGYLPKAKLANTDLITAMMAQVGQNPILAQSFGTMLPNMFTHLATLGGIQGLEQYIPEQPQQGQTNEAGQNNTGADAQAADAQ